MKKGIIPISRVEHRWQPTSGIPNKHFHNRPCGINLTIAQAATATQLKLITREVFRR